MNFGQHQLLAYCCTFICEIDVEIDSGKTNRRGVWECVCVCLQWPIRRQVPITGSNSVCGGSSRRILSKLASLR